MNIRNDFLIKDGISFLNHGSFGATPRPVLEAQHRWQTEMEIQPVEFLGRRAHTLLSTSIEILADFLHTERDNLVYVTNATTAMNIVAHSLELGPGDEVLSTDHEYGAMDRTWRFLSQKFGFSLVSQPIPVPLTTKEAIIDQFWRGVTPRTKAISISHITSPTALIFPVKEICRRARAAGILTVVDGAHAPGQIALNLTDLDADFYAGNLHKWLCAPKGSAFLFANPGVQNMIRPLTVSWGWENPDRTCPEWIDYLEWSGTRDLSAFLAVPDAIEYEKSHDWTTVQSDCHHLLSNIRSQIHDLFAEPALCPDSPEWYAQMASIELPRMDPGLLKTTLYDTYQVEVPVIEWQDKLLIRVSIQAYNTPADGNHLVEALKKIYHR
jgi:isopenicillin-N epimerase